MMKTKVLLIALIQKNGAFLMRKKPDGSPPYKETWYLFGAELENGNPPEETLKKWVKEQAGVDITIKEELGWDTEVKADIDDETKQFIYLDCLCEYAGGDLKAAPGIEKLEWIPFDQLRNFDIVPPSVILLKKLGYM